MFWRIMSACQASSSLAASMAAAAAALVTGSPEVPTDKGKHPKAAAGVAPDVPEHHDHFWGQPCPPHRPGARRVDRGPAVVACHVVHYGVPARNDDLLDVGHLPLGERVPLGQAGAVAGAALDGAAAALAGAACVQPARRAGAPYAPARRPPLGLPRIARRDRLSPAVLGRPRAASRRGMGAVVVPVARDEPLVVAVQGGPVGLEHPDPLVALRARPFRLGLQRREPAGHRSHLLVLSVHVAAQAQVPGDGRHEFFAHDHKVGSGHNPRVLHDHPYSLWGPCGGAAAGRPAALQDPILQGHALTFPPAVCWGAPEHSPCSQLRKYTNSL